MDFLSIALTLNWFAYELLYSKAFELVEHFIRVRRPNYDCRVQTRAGAGNSNDFFPRFYETGIMGTTTSTVTTV